MMRGLLPILLFASGIAAAAEPVVQAPLYDGPAAGSENWSEPRKIVECNGDVSIYNTREPRYSLYLPDPDGANGTAVINLPGGAMRVLGVGRNMDAEVEAFLAQGIAVAVLEYRTRQLPDDSIPRECRPPDPDAPPIRFPKMEIRNGNANPAPNDPVGNEVLRLAVDDARAMLRLLHERADDWQIDPDKVGLIGTSAGGGVAFGAMLADSPPEERPDFLISIFGPSLQDVVVPDDAPPLYLVTEADHGPVTDGLLAVFSIWKDAGEKVELHIYEVPNFSMTVDLWGPRLFDWMAEQGIQPSD